jgi:putative glutamine amidotransferase
MADQARRPLIGVTGHGGDATSGSRSVAALEAYLAAVRQAGGLPVVLPPTSDPALIAAYVERVDGVLFTGGRDISPAHYGEATLNDTVQIEDARDAFELPLARAAVLRDRPVLAICRGCQVLAVAMGGSLWQDLPAQQPRSLPHRQTKPRDAVTHAVGVQAGSLLARALGESTRQAIETNTFHHQAVRRVPPGLAAVAHTPDGTIEGVEAPDRRFVLGVQWHPEGLVERRPEHRRLFAAFVQAARSEPAP